MELVSKYITGRSLDNPEQYILSTFKFGRITGVIKDFKIVKIFFNSQPYPNAESLKAFRTLTKEETKKLNEIILTLDILKTSNKSFIGE
jgi:hypothetical protein